MLIPSSLLNKDSKTIFARKKKEIKITKLKRFDETKL